MANLTVVCPLCDVRHAFWYQCREDRLDRDGALLWNAHAAALLKVSTGTIVNWVKQEKIPHVRTKGNRIRVPYSAVKHIRDGKCPFCGTFHPASSGCAA